MSLINHEELKKQLASGEITSLDDITAEFKNILKEVIQTASQEELTSHLGYSKNQESESSNSRNGYNEKTIKSKYGQFDVSIPRDRDSSFEPQLVKKREIIGIWIGENETSKYWLTVLNDIQKRGIQDVLIFAIDGLNGFNEAIKAVYPKAEIQRCIVHQIRSSLKFVSWKDRKAVAKDLKSVYSAHNEEDAQLALTDFNDIWGKKYPNITVSWTNHWSGLSTFFKYPDSVRKLIYTTNPIESLNATIKRKTKSKGSFPTEASAFKVMYLATQEQQNKWNMSSIRNWYEIYPQLSIFFSEIMSKYTK